MFRDVRDSSEQLVEKLQKKVDENWLIVAVSEEAISFAEILSTLLKVDYQLFFIDSISCQNNSDCEVAFISEFNIVQFNETLRDAFGLDNDTMMEALQVIYEYKLLPEIENYRGSRRYFQLPDGVDTVLLIDNSIETGFRMEVAIDSMETLGIEDIYIATPVIPSHIFDLFEPMVEEIIYIEKVDFYTDIHDYYEVRDKDRNIEESHTLILR
jgi:putative phosphoribosyl transferase